MLDLINSICDAIARFHAKKIKNRLTTEKSIDVDTPIFGSQEAIRKVYFWFVIVYLAIVVGFFGLLLWDNWRELRYIFEYPKRFWSDFPLIVLLISVGYWFVSSFISFSIADDRATTELKKSSAEYIKQRSLNHNRLVAQEKQRILEENQARLAAEEAARKIKQAEDEAYRKRLQEIEDVEAAKSRGQAKGLAELYRHQIELLVEYKKRGADIEKEVFEMRGKLLKLEGEENKSLLGMLKELDSI